MITETTNNIGSKTPNGACRAEICAKKAHADGILGPGGVSVENKKTGGKNHQNQSRIWIQDVYYNLIRMEKLIHEDESIPCALNRVLEAYYTPEKVDSILVQAGKKIVGKNDQCQNQRLRSF